MTLRDADRYSWSMPFRWKYLPAIFTNAGALNMLPCIIDSSMVGITTRSNHASKFCNWLCGVSRCML